MDKLDSENQHVLIGKNLKDFFEGQNLTQKDIADKLGVSQAAVSSLLNGKPFGKKLAQKWSAVFGFNPSWLITGEGNMMKGKQVTNVSENADVAVVGDEKPLTRLYISEMIELQKGYQSMLKTSQEQISKLIAIIEKQSNTLP